ncbi:unnamed protein product [Arabidopsis halleri]
MILLPLGQNPPELEEILNHCREKDRHLQSYFTHFLEKQLKVVAMKPQHFKDMRGSAEPQRVRKLLEKHNERVLQRVMIAAVFLQKADVYIFDEPSSLLDVRQKFKAAQVIRSLLTLDSYVIVAENDISLLDYLSDVIYCLYGKPEAHGIVSPDYGVRSGIEIFLAGFDHSRNLRIRDESLIFEDSSTTVELLDRKVESLSPVETQRVALTICLGSPASVYLIDEPGAYLDSELRINAAMAIRRHVLRMGKAAIVVEHDLTMATYMADQVIVVDGKRTNQLYY